MTAAAGETNLAQIETDCDADLWGSAHWLTDLALVETDYDPDLWGLTHWLSAELWAGAVRPMMSRVSEALDVHRDLIGSPRLSEKDKRTDELALALLGLALPALGRDSGTYSKVLQSVGALLYHSVDRPRGVDELSYWVEISDRQRVLLAEAKQRWFRAQLPYVVNSWLAPLGLDGLDNVDVVFALCQMVDPYLRHAETLIARHAERLGSPVDQAVSFQPAVERSERRAGPRRQIRCATLIEPGGVCATAVDVSSGGAYVLSLRPLSVGATICLTLHTSQGTVEARGVVRRAEEGPRRGADPAARGLGIQFTQPPKNLAGLLGAAA